MLERLTSATFTPLVGQHFSAAAEGDTLDLVLSACEESRFTGPPAPDGTARRVPFSLLFHAADGRLLPQQIFTISHAELGQFPLFLVPLGPDGAGMRYEAVVS